MNILIRKKYFILYIMKNFKKTRKFKNNFKKLYKNTKHLKKGFKNYKKITRYLKKRRKFRRTKKLLKGGNGETEEIAELKRLFGIDNNKSIFQRSLKGKTLEQLADMEDQAQSTEVKQLIREQITAQLQDDKKPLAPPLSRQSRLS